MIFCRKGSKGEPGKEAIYDPTQDHPKSEHQPAVQSGATQSRSVFYYTPIGIDARKRLR